MASNIVPGNLDGEFPIAGIDNDSQGFRTNFTNTSTNFSAAKAEIEDLQAKTILKAPLDGETTVDNDMLGEQLKAATFIDSRETIFAHSTVTGTVEIDHQNGHYQTLTTTGPITLTFTNFPGTGGTPVNGRVRVEMTIADLSHTVTLGPEVSIGASFIAGYVSGGTIGVDPGTITFTTVDTYTFEFTTIDSTTYTIHDIIRGSVSETSGIFNIVEDTTPQLGGALDVQGFAINTSTVNGDITLTPNGTGDIVLGTLKFDGDQTVGAGQDMYHLAYDNASGLVALTAPGTGTPNFKSYSAADLGLSGTFYLDGFYNYSEPDANLNSAGPATVTWGSANESHAAHAFIVASGPGSANLVLTVSGISITDAGVRTPADSEIIVADATAVGVVTDAYFETSKKWLGQITYTLTDGGGGNGTFTFNYGLVKYEDFGNRNFDVSDFEVTGHAGASEAGLNVELLHHEATAFTYHATAFVPNQTAAIAMATDHGADVVVAAGDNFAYKRAAIPALAIAGAASEGTIIRVTTSSNNSINYLNAHIGVTLT
jgi:hypothetical protein